MEVIAQSKSVRMSPRKVRLVAQGARRKSAQQALTMLSQTRQRAALVISSTIKSAVANATHNAKLSPETLWIKSIEVTEGPSLKRFHPSTRGRVHPYKKRSSHIRVILEEKLSAAKAVSLAKVAVNANRRAREVKNNGTKS